MAEGTLPLESRIRPDKIFTLKQALAVRKLGRVRADIPAHVKRELQAIFA